MSGLFGLVRGEWKPCFRSSRLTLSVRVSAYYIQGCFSSAAAPSPTPTPSYFVDVRYPTFGAPSPIPVVNSMPSVRVRFRSPRFLCSRSPSAYYCNRWWLLKRVRFQYMPSVFSNWKLTPVKNVPCRICNAKSPTCVVSILPILSTRRLFSSFNIVWNRGSELSRLVFQHVRLLVVLLFIRFLLFIFFVGFGVRLFDIKSLVRGECRYFSDISNAYNSFNTYFG